MSKTARIAAVLVLIATAASEVGARAVYRHSTDGQTGAFWVLMVVYGVLALGTIWVLDVAARRFRNRTPGV